MAVTVRQVTEHRFIVRGAGPAVLKPPVLSPTIRIVQGAAPYSQGGGGTSPSYQHTQSSPSDQWIVNHNLGFYPNISVFSPGGLEVETSVIHTSVNQVVIDFEIPYTGVAVAR